MDRKPILISRHVGGHWNGLFMKALKREIDIAMEGYYGSKDDRG